MSRNDESWTTTHEKQHINKLGTWTAKRPSLRRTEVLLKNYIKSAWSLRKNWEDINMDKVITHAQKRLNGLYE